MKEIFKTLVLLIFIGCSAIILPSCQSTRKASKEKSTTSRSDVENFDIFYDKFHKDSLFQISRTKFPLGGMFVDGLGQKEWTRENLNLMKTRIYDIDTTQYKVSYEKTDRTFTQKVWIEDSGFSSESKFELIDNKWYLVYVLDHNL